MSDDRKYKQRGYQDDGRERKGPRPEGGGAPRPDREPGAPAGARRISSEGARNPNMPGFHQVARCSRCGSHVDAEIFSRSKCTKCSQDLRSCAQCMYFDPGARWECSQIILVRIPLKDVANECTLYTPRTSYERETSSAQASKPSEPSGAKKAFDDLFKF
ncbi:MAG TPA: hypothetical protein VNJ02_09035 [Vicinamibacterales bacterium]|nr:hypothetical protein [Vicinamibacterales bacterium]